MIKSIVSISVLSVAFIVLIASCIMYDSDNAKYTASVYLVENLSDLHAEQAMEAIYSKSQLQQELQVLSDQDGASLPIHVEKMDRSADGKHVRYLIQMQSSDSSQSIQELVNVCRSFIDKAQSGTRIFTLNKSIQDLETNLIQQSQTHAHLETQVDQLKSECDPSQLADLESNYSLLANEHDTLSNQITDFEEQQMKREKNRNELVLQKLVDERHQTGDWVAKKEVDIQSEVTTLLSTLDEIEQKYSKNHPKYRKLAKQATMLNTYITYAELPETRPSTTNSILPVNHETSEWTETSLSSLESQLKETKRKLEQCKQAKEQLEKMLTKRDSYLEQMQELDNEARNIREQINRLQQAIRVLEHQKMIEYSVQLNQNSITHDHSSKKWPLTIIIAFIGLCGAFLIGKLQWHSNN